MRCEEVREVVEEAKAKEFSARLQEHLAGCAACEAYARDWRLLRTGFRALAVEPVPEPSWGFTTRLLRRLEQVTEPSRGAEEFLERVGRRVVYGTFLLALMLLLALVLPSSGPLRGPGLAEVYRAQSEVAMMESDPLFASELPAGQDLAPVNPTGWDENGEK